MSWSVIEHGDEIHVLPKDDLKPHKCSKDCSCGPWLDDGVWVHNSADLRELSEGTRQ